ncbi:MAG: ROK family protein [Intrasporangiaceae bacterium]|nr:ROK family protein [Intrasporangiaceae bacterium]
MDELAIDEDPVTAHRAARRPVPMDGGATPMDGGATPVDGGAAPVDGGAAPVDGAAAPDPGRDAPSAGATHDPSTCGLCPVCIGLRMLGEYRPEVLDHLNQASRHLSAALRGLLDAVRYGPNIGIRDLPLARQLEERVGRAVTVLNDASAAAFAEQRVGAARGYLDVVMFTLGTGVGGGVTRGGDLVLGRSGYAGETGHMIVAEGGRRCPCGNRGCIEAYASGTAIGAMARDRLEDGDEPSMLRDVDHDRVDGRAVSDAARAGDAVAREVLGTAGRWLGVAAASVVNLLDPDIIVVGGGAATSTAPWLLPEARRAMRERLLGAEFREPPAIELATLADDAGTVGAGLYAATGPVATRADVNGGQ